MADLKPLIRFRKHTVDEKQRALAVLYRERENIEKQKKVVEDQMAHESAVGNEMATPEARAALGLYLQGARRKIEALNKTLKAMDQRIARAQEEIREHFAELKKVEITQDLRDKREAAVRKKKEEDTFDAIGIEQFGRREERD